MKKSVVGRAEVWPDAASGVWIRLMAESKWGSMGRMFAGEQLNQTRAA